MTRFEARWPHTYHYGFKVIWMWGQYLIYTLTGPVGARRLWEGCNRAIPQVAADTTVSVLLLEASLRQPPILATIWTCYRHALLISRVGAAKVRAHLIIHLTSRRVNTAAVATGPHPRHCQSLVENIYQIRPLKLVDVVPGNKPSHSGINFPREENNSWFSRCLSSDWLFCKGMHGTTCASDTKTYALQEITNSHRAVARSAH